MTSDALLNEYLAAKNHCALLLDAHLQAIKITGSDSFDFLQRMLTQDIKSLTPGKGARGMFLQNNGKILMDFDILSFENFLLLLVTDGYARPTCDLLDKYIITEDVQLQILPHKTLALQGPRAFSTLSQEITLENNYDHTASSNPTLEGDIIRKDITGLGGYLVLALPAAMSNWEEFFMEKTIPLLTEEVYNSLVLENGLMRFGHELSGEILLPETGLEKICASETKGCYPGQEVVARIETYKGLRRLMVLARFFSPHPPKSTAPIQHEGKIIGEIITSAKQLNSESSLALCILKYEYASKDQSIVANAIKGEVIGGAAATLLK